MALLPRLRSLLRSLTGRGPVQRDLSDEVGSYYSMLVDEHIARGLGPADARRRARLEMGGVEQVKESVRAVRPGLWLDTFQRDVRHSVRLLLKTPAFSFTAILVLALGIGANAAVFSLINVLVLQPLPGEHRPGHVAGIFSHDPTRPGSYRTFSYREYEALRDRTDVFLDVMAHRTIRVLVRDGADSRRSRAAAVTASYFDTLGVGLVAGRTFTPAEERPGSRAAVAVLGYAMWQRIGGRLDAVGQTITVDGQAFTVIGIAPRGFVGPLALAGPEFWMPLGAVDLLSSSPAAAPAPSGPPRGLLVVGRLKPTVTMEAADAALRAWSPVFYKTGVPDDGRRLLTVSPLARSQQSPRPADDSALALPLGALMGAALVVLIIASLNVANMQLARGTGRRKEIAMRLALGAGRARVIGQLLTEGLVLASAGGVVGVALSVWALQGVVASFTPVLDEALAADIMPDWRVGLASLVFCTLAVLGFGLVPAWRLSGVDVLPELKSQDGGGPVPRTRRLNMRNLLVASQIALSLALLAATGLFVRGAIVAGRATPGYRFDDQLLMRVDAALAGRDEVAGRQAYARLIDQIRATPGVESASMASFVAFGNDSNTRRVRKAGLTSGGSGEAAGPDTHIYAVGSAYFETLRLALLRGREFTPAEEREPSASRIVIIDETLASALFPGEDPLGQYVQWDNNSPARGADAFRVIGVAPGLRHHVGDRGPVPHVYVPLGSNYRTSIFLHARTRAGGAAAPTLQRTLRQRALDADARLSVVSLQSLDDARDSTPTNWIVRVAGWTFGALGAIALFMAAIGLYSVKAYLVARRTREIGVRLALGASNRDVIRMILKEGSALLVASLAVGFLLAMALGRIVSGLLVGVEPFDPLVLSVATAVLAGAVLAACYIPARRATRVSPVTALRTE